MSPDELERFSREDLLELLRRQQEELAERDAAIERRDAKIRELEDELAQFRRPAKTPENSSLRPSRGRKVNRCERRHISYERVEEICRHVFRPPISQGGIDHALRRLVERAWALAPQHVLGRSVRLYHECEQVSPAAFARRRVLIENATDRLVFGPPLAAKSEARRLQKRYQAHRDSLYVFLDGDDVEPTNNSSERDPRPAVIHRKVIGGYRSD